MTQAKSYISARELLFKRLLIVASLASLITCVLQFLISNFKDLYLGLAFLLFISFTWLIFEKVSKTIAYHLLLLNFIVLLSYPVIVLGDSYYAIIIYPLAGLIYNFVFFDGKKVQWFYFLFFIVLEFFLLSSTMQVEIGNLTGRFFVEYVNALAYMIALFFIGNYFINNLKQQQRELINAQEDIENQQKELVAKNKTLDKYIESNNQLESFAHLAAHELKAPLRNMTGFAGLLRRKVKDKLTPEEDKMFGVISNSNKQMHEMIGALNQLGSVCQMKLKTSKFDVKELVDEILFDRKESISISNAVVKTEIVAPFVYADRILLKQLLSNLIGNALKFVPEDRSPVVHISFVNHGGNNQFRIDDNGIGIESEDREKIFALFERLNCSNLFSGSGIGLAICKKIVDVHQGEIWVEESALGGSSFVLNIPNENHNSPTIIQREMDAMHAMKE